MANEMNNGTANPGEKEVNGGHTHLDSNHDPDTALRKIQTAGSISISPELFEKIYLSPQNVVKGDIRKTFANPTPVCLVGFLLTLTPLSCQLLGWGGITNTNSPGQATLGTYFFFGGLLMLIGAVGEFLLGNTFPMVVFGSFGSFWLVFGTINDPIAFSVNSSYAATKADPDYYRSFAFFLIFMGVLCFVYLILSLRTNLVFFCIFLALVPAFACLAKAYFLFSDYFLNAALGGSKKAAAPAYLTSASKYIKAGGGLTFVVCALGWWIFSAIMLASLDFPFQLPVGDLSHIIKGASEKQQ